MVFSLAELALPVLAAPMAGGPGTPALAAAVSNAGGLGFIAGGHLAPRRLADEIGEARALTRGPIGVNLLVPQPSVADTLELDEYAEYLDPLAGQYGVHVGLSDHGHGSDDDSWSEQLAVVADLRPTAVSFTFGAPPPAVLATLHDLWIMVLITVTSRHEADVAVAHGADGLIVQGPCAGWHRGTFDPRVLPGTEPLEDLLDEIGAAHAGVPLVAAGGLGTPGDVAGMLRRGAVAVQVGTALLLSDEAGTGATYRSALQHGEFGTTVVTAAFSGRYGRCLENDFTRAFDSVAPLGYPEVNHLTEPIRAAAAAMDDPHGTSLWAGTAYQSASSRPAGEIVEDLAAGRA